MVDQIVILLFAKRSKAMLVRKKFNLLGALTCLISFCLGCELKKPKNFFFFFPSIVIKNYFNIITYFIFSFFRYLNVIIITMDKIFDRNITEQDSILCKIPHETFQKISKFLSPTDVVRLSHTCKELHQNLPFYLLKIGGRFLNKQKASGVLFKGSAINFPVSEIDIRGSLSICSFVPFGCEIWIKITRGEKVALETEKCYGSLGFQLTKTSSILREYRPGDRIWFMFSIIDGAKYIYFEASLKLENYEYGKPIYCSQNRMGYAEFTRPSILMNIPSAESRQSLTG